MERIIDALQDNTIVGGSCEPIFDGQSRAARFLTWLHPYLRKSGLRYGDSAIFVRRDAYRSSGGFKLLPILKTWI